MKNSPHRHKHQVNKAVRESKRTHPLPKKEPKEKKAAQMARDQADLREFNQRLTPLNPKMAQEILELYKKHFERARHMEPKHSKRANPGMIEGESPFTHIRHHKGLNPKQTNQPSLEKSHEIGRKVFQKQNFRKAA